MQPREFHNSLGRRFASAEGQKPLQDRIPKHSKLLFEHAYNNLIASAPPADNPRLFLADYLEKINTETTPSPREAMILRGIATYDAKKLVSEMLSTQVIERLGITEDIGFDARNEQIRNGGFTPSLKDILLLAEACDTLGDEKLLNALQYITEHFHDQLNHELVLALDRAKESGMPVRYEYQQIIAQRGEELDQLAVLQLEEKPVRTKHEEVDTGFLKAL